MASVSRLPVVLSAAQLERVSADMLILEHLERGWRGIGWKLRKAEAVCESTIRALADWDILART